MPETHVGSVLALTGSWKVDARYGRQFVVETFEETLPATAYGIEKYLGSGLVKGIGPKFAQRIVREFGQDTLTVIEDNPDDLYRILGIGVKRVERIKQSWQEQKEIKNIMLFLQEHNVSTAHATKIYKTYKNESIQIVRENPYRLADDIWGIGFKTADTIAERMGFEHEKYVRLRSGLLYTLNKLSEEGHCYAVREQLLKTGCELLKVEKYLLSMTIDEMIRVGDVKTEQLMPPIGEEANPESNALNDEDSDHSKKRLAMAAEEEIRVKAENTAIYLPPFYYSEVGTARRLYQIYEEGKSISLRISGLLERIQEANGIAYDENQLEAIRKAVISKIMLLTGGPGTGKTTTTLGIITAYKEAGAKILLAAPTGRAAKRLSEATGLEAKTIHRLLEVKPPDGYQRNEENPLEGDVLIVDECSMIDILLMYNLLKAVPNTMTVILVGDIDQLPSVGPGNVLRDIIESKVFPVVRLTKIFRQAQSSRIIMNAHRINKGQMPDLSNGRKTDFFFIEQDEPETTVNRIVELVQKRLPRHYKVTNADIQVLTPMQRGVVGATNLNQMLQAAINPTGDGLRRGGYIFRERDKVMQIRNNYDKEVFNGDIGVVNAVDLEDREITIEFDGRQVKYDVTELDEIVLAYATTIHKAQGSEYPIVVMPALMTHYVMLQRNLIYTGVTRAKHVLVMIGSKKALRLAIKNNAVNKRNTMLSLRLTNGRISREP